MKFYLKLEVFFKNPTSVKSNSKVLYKQFYSMPQECCSLISSLPAKTKTRIKKSPA
jgi:hypothetical protein